MKNKIYRSPLFYVGDKFKLIEEIREHFPSKINKFIEPFTGGGSVFLNIHAKEYLLNDIDKNVYLLHKFLMKQSSNTSKFLSNVENLIDDYKLSKSFKEDIVPMSLKNTWKKTFYAKFNKMGFEKLRTDFNNDTKKSILKLYILLIYGFNRMLRFNTENKYNLPVGNVDFNANVLNALNEYFILVTSKSISWYNLDYKKFLESIQINENDFVYLDPPYLITFSEYNKRWNEQKEYELLKILNELNAKGIKFAISNVTHYKGKENKLFLQWSKQYKSYPIKSNYISYHDNSIKNFNEVLITNYVEKK
ncbi:MAG: Dam family site-specific DNA-(adenine-N6)-methyltransferase [Sediminibacterium sp.]|nr:Dam family site-specific DNA-(adenine-N6)-methyltransferase [Sediminibacterium sp.]